MKFWNNSVKKAKLTHAKYNEYYFINPKSGATYLLRQDLQDEYHFEICPKNDDIFDEWETSQENIDILLDKIAKFKKEFENAKEEKDGFTSIRFPQLKNFCLYYKRLNRLQYQFIIVTDEETGRVYNQKNTPDKLLSDFSSVILSMLRESDDELFDVTVRKAENILPHENSPLYLSAKERDEYLSAEIAYFFGKQTREVVDTLNAVRKEPVFLVEKEIYDIGDISEINDIERGPISFFNRRAYYYLKVFIRDRFYKAQWEPIKQELRMNCFEDHIEISEALHEKIQLLTGETPKQTKTREFLQLENYHYGYKDGLSRLPIEKRNEIFEKLGQVSLEDLKSLPLMHLKRLTIAQLYDWLHCSGNTSNPVAVAFVGDLAKLRKENYKY